MLIIYILSTFLCMVLFTKVMEIILQRGEFVRKIDLVWMILVCLFPILNTLVAWAYVCDLFADNTLANELAEDLRE